MQSFKKLMSIRKTSNELIEDLIGHDPEKLCLENIRKAEQRLTERKVILIRVMNLLETDDKPVILLSHGICYGIIIFFL